MRTWNHFIWILILNWDKRIWRGMGSFRLWWTTEAEMNQIQNHKRSNLKSKCFRVIFLIYKHIFPGKFCENILERYSEVVVGWFCFWQTIRHTLQARQGSCNFAKNYKIHSLLSRGVGDSISNTIVIILFFFVLAYYNGNY